MNQENTQRKQYQPNMINVTGFVLAEPTVRTTDNGTVLNARIMNHNGSDSTAFNVEYWGSNEQVLETAAKISKGSTIEVIGKVTTKMRTADGKTYVDLVVKAKALTSTRKPKAATTTTETVAA